MRRRMHKRARCTRARGSARSPLSQMRQLSVLAMLPGGQALVTQSQARSGKMALAR